MYGVCKTGGQSKVAAVMARGGQGPLPLAPLSRGCGLLQLPPVAEWKSAEDRMGAVAGRRGN